MQKTYAKKQENDLSETLGVMSAAFPGLEPVIVRILASIYIHR